MMKIIQKKNESFINLEAEQALLGALLVNNLLFLILKKLKPRHFYEPVHSRIFKTMRFENIKGRIANPITLKHFFDNDDDLADLEGGVYLARIAAASVVVTNIQDYERIIVSLAKKRKRKE